MKPLSGTGITSYILKFDRLFVNLRLFVQNFSYIGNGLGYVMARDGPAEFIFYASGRVHCQFVWARIQVIFTVNGIDPCST